MRNARKNWKAREKIHLCRCLVESSFDLVLLFFSMMVQLGRRIYAYFYIFRSLNRGRNDEKLKIVVLKNRDYISLALKFEKR